MNAKSVNERKAIPLFSYLLNIVLLVIIIILFVIYKNPTSQNNSRETYIDSLIQIDNGFIKKRITQFDSLKKYDSSRNFSFSQPFNDLRIAIDYIQYFRDDLTKLSSASGVASNEVVTSVWVDKSTLNHFWNLCFNSPANCDGLRLYFAKYKPNEIDPTRETEFPSVNVDNKYTLIMVATRLNAGGQHENYYVQNPGTGVYTGLYDYNKPCPPKCYDSNLNDPFPQ